MVRSSANKAFCLVGGRRTIEGTPDQNTTTPRKEYFDTPVARHIETPIATSDSDIEMPNDRDFGTAAAISFDRDVDTTVASLGQDGQTSLESLLLNDRPIAPRRNPEEHTTVPIIVVTGAATNTATAATISSEILNMDL
ncbi:hypothetical protein GE061_012529 [Apolygus lucorum]|uniref:Uncharacterized protein n=1 Tax=Apolygus lucorum TaxID=248454 RepID=A0A8S9XUN0_APOLU|nr:hypothetical protein GE061_012529 [Apolygus lucorum]